MLAQVTYMRNTDSFVLASPSGEVGASPRHLERSVVIV